jgi:hypothetical protein
VRTVLIIGADFAPSSLPPATRIRFFAKHLREFGWEPIILTTKSEHYDWPVDPENEQLLAPTLEVIRTHAWKSSWTRRIGIGDIGMRSLWHTWAALKRLCRERPIDLILIPVPPSVPMVLGRMAHKKFGIPYVIDYIDPWVTDAYKKLPRNHRPPKWFFANALSRILEPFSLKYVSHITGVSKGTTDSVLDRYKWLKEENATEIPYGSEADDFAYVRKHPRKNPIFESRDGMVHLSYVGACIPQMYSTVRAIFKGVKLGLEQFPDMFSRLRLHFVGTSYAPSGNAPTVIPSLAREFDVGGLVDERSSRVSYLDSLQIMLDSDALFLIGSDEPHYTASKVFPYMLSQRPLMAVFHSASTVVSVLENYSGGRVITYSDTQLPGDRSDEIMKVLSSILNKEIEPVCETNRLEAFSTRTMTRRLAEAFDKALSPKRLETTLLAGDALHRDASA